MHVFADDSGSISQDQFLCVVGLVAKDPNWDDFDNSWHYLLSQHKLPFIHTSDFLSGHGPYASLNFSYDRRLLILQDFMHVVRHHAEVALIVGVDVAAYRAATGTSRKRLQPLTFLFLRLLKKAHTQMDLWGTHEPVSFYFDDDAKVAPKLYSAWSTVKRFKRAGRESMAGITFGDDALLSPLQAADLVGCAYTRGRRNGLAPWENESEFRLLFHHTDGSSLPVYDEIWTQEKISADLPDIIAAARND
ncbi:DUF3800 domain-containing protein [Brevundimonas aveniformis]|uniref:DUF3800 domain-containing protein n=1 Tax=Brevundimonas aveniformis TaxID=370977 RepID=UPI0024930347|nr:DUF3800 domain-containing protein [Brevundimonas aveniformis]